MTAAFFRMDRMRPGPMCPIALNMRQKQYNSYLIRIWQTDFKHDGGAIPQWQGEVIHIQTGQFWRVHDLELLSDLLEDLMTKSKPAERKEGYVR